MRKLKTLRIIVQVVAFGTFVFQMQNSVRKYVDKPVVQQTSTTNLDNTEKPLIYICQDGQFNYTQSKLHGYTDMTYFTNGYNDDLDNYTWKGKYRNRTFKDLQELLFNSKDPNFVAAVGNSWEEIETEKMYLAAFGYCTKVQLQGNYIYLQATQKSSFYMVDPYTENSLIIYKLDNGKGSFGPISNNLYEYFIYALEISLHDSYLYEGTGCTDYWKLNQSYGDCIEEALKGMLLDSYGCLPPWFPKNTSSICEDAIEISYDHADNSDTYDEMYRLASNQKLKVFKQCLKPCMSMGLKLKELHALTEYDEFAGAEIEFNDKKITVYKDVLAYDSFSLIVDLGSSLGLWLGLSALSIFDSLLEMIGVIIHQTKTKRQKK